MSYMSNNWNSGTFHGHEDITKCLSTSMQWLTFGNIPQLIQACEKNRQIPTLFPEFQDPKKSIFF